MISTSKLRGIHDSSSEKKKKKYPLAEATLGCVNEGKQISPDTMSWRENQMGGGGAVLSLDPSLR